MRIVSVFFGAGIIFITYKILKELNLNIKWSILSATLVFLFIKDNFYIDYNYAILFITLLLIYIELKYKSYNIKYNILIGFLAGITILFKQSTGGCITFITVFYIILQRRNRTTLKAIMARFLGAIIPCILFIIYLIATNSVFSFIDYCILGIGTFENSVSYSKLLQGKDFYAFIALIVPISLLMLLIINLRNIKRKEINEKSDYLILFVYSIAQFIIVYPIADKIHFVIASVPTIIVILYYICKSIQNIRKIKVSIFIEHFMNVITISFVCILCLQAINEIYLYSTTEKSVLNHFANIPINQSLQNRILQIDEFINVESNIVGKREVPTTNKELKEYIQKRCPFNHMTVMFRKSDIMSVGNYKEWFLNEDYYLWIRLALANKKFANLPEILVHVRTGADMYQRRGGMKYFVSERDIQKFMYEQGVIGYPRYVINVSERLILQVLMPNWLRGIVFRVFARK